MTATLALKHDSLAEWSKALASGASPQGRGFEPHSCHFTHCQQTCLPGMRLFFYLCRASISGLNGASGSVAGMRFWALSRKNLSKGQSPGAGQVQVVRAQASKRSKPPAFQRGCAEKRRGDPSARAAKSGNRQTQQKATEEAERANQKKMPGEAKRLRFKGVGPKSGEAPRGPKGAKATQTKTEIRNGLKVFGGILLLACGSFLPSGQAKLYFQSRDCDFWPRNCKPQTLPGRLELPTLRLTASRSNQLSYGSQ